MTKRPIVTGMLLVCIVTTALGNDGSSATIMVHDGSVRYEKGNIDYDVLAEVILQKQEELKGRLIRGEILRHFYNTSHATRLYVSKSLTALLTVKNKSVMQEELLGLTADYMLVQAVTCIFCADTTNKKVIDSAEIKHKEFVKQYQEAYSEAIKLQLLWLPFRESGRFVKDFIAPFFSSHHDSASDSTFFDELLVDMVFDAVYRNPLFRELGFFRETSCISDRYTDYDSANLYLSDSSRLTFGATKAKNVIPASRNTTIHHFNQRELEKRQRLTDFVVLADSLISTITNRTSDSSSLAASIDAIRTTIGLSDTSDNSYYTSLKKLMETDSTYKNNLHCLHTTIVNYVDSVICRLVYMDALIDGRAERLRKRVDEVADSMYSQVNKTTENDSGDVNKVPDTVSTTSEQGDSAGAQVTNPAKVAPTPPAPRNQPLDTLVSALCDSIVKTRNLVLYDRCRELHRLVAQKRFDPLITRSGCDVLTSIASDTAITSGSFMVTVQIRDSLLSLMMNAIKKDTTSLLAGLCTDSGIRTNDSIMDCLRFISLIDGSEGKTTLFDNMFVVAERRGNNLTNSTARNAVNTIFSSMKRYTEIDREQKTVSMDVGSIIAEMYKRYTHRSKTWVYIAPTFTLGINSFLFSKNMTIDIDSIKESNIDFANVFASEKLGLRWKIYNNRYVRSFDIGDRFTYYGKEHIATHDQEDPLLSELYLIVYCSGLLYNIVNVKTKKDFDAPLFGAGLGLTLFNGLNIAVGGGFAYEGKNSRRLYGGVSFDIDIVEYCNQLTENIRQKR